ncbi:hypothetical protein DXH95_03170 [Sphingorhabdus pulchriflava]|uniref:Uncharacterized protein n=1 Tax=Sphingorhabdus pulchriflava TaxID=2292257 RepID=A0A371BFR3_9SPHN|nr:hypothetical protein [Sphingorhabdus pulchriflava]RDV06442.1 hypothetical protein DXH95_03170 [Sphingorhabdus pulchriflava]
MNEGGVSPGEAGGLFAGILATATLVGAGIKWLWGEGKATALTRRQKLDTWHAELKEREAKIEADEAAFHARIEQRLNVLERESRVLGRAFELVAAALRVKDPKNQALAEAERLLIEAFPDRAGGG